MQAIHQLPSVADCYKCKVAEIMCDYFAHTLLHLFWSTFLLGLTDTAAFSNGLTGRSEVMLVDTGLIFSLLWDQSSIHVEWEFEWHPGLPISSCSKTHTVRDLYACGSIHVCSQPTLSFSHVYRCIVHACKYHKNSRLSGKLSALNCGGRLSGEFLWTVIIKFRSLIANYFDQVLHKMFYFPNICHKTSTQYT